MLRKVLWIAAACAAVLATLAASRMLGFDRPAAPPASQDAAPAAEENAAPAVAAEPAPPPEPAPAPPAPPPTPEEQQILDDAAATGMTTIEPEPDAPQN